LNSNGVKNGVVYKVIHLRVGVKFEKKKEIDGNVMDFHQSFSISYENKLINVRQDPNFLT
jgi:hypothetical protein